MGHVFYELFAMLSMRGDGATVPVLAELMPELDEQEQRGALVALAAIGRRLGARDLGRILGDSEDTTGEGGQLAAELLKKPIPAPEDYFSLTYSGFA